MTTSDEGLSDEEKRESGWKSEHTTPLKRRLRAKNNVLVRYSTTSESPRPRYWDMYPAREAVSLVVVLEPGQSHIV